ncbi:MAG: preprotein translocase subunit SecY [Candidatus Paceibacterota bacterium]
MNNFLAKTKLVLQDKILRQRILFTLVALAVFRLFSVIPIPGVDALKLEQFFSGNQFLGLLDVFSGGGLSTLSIVMLGVGPYITASIIMQLLTIMSPKLKAIYHEEGEAGRKRFAQYSRLLTVPLALIQAFGFLLLLEKQGVVPGLETFGFVTNIMVIVGGSILLTWLGELITEFGIGNGVSLIIFAGIVARVPVAISQLSFTFEVSQIPVYLAFLIIGLLVIVGVVIITEAERPVPITYAKRVRGMKMYGGLSTYLPLRINQGGVIPIIFALSILLFPQMIFTFLANTGNPIVVSISTFMVQLLSQVWLYALLYFILVVLFTYFYTAVTFEPESIATNLQKGGAFIPGVRPGQSTTEYLAKIVTRITLVGAVFLGVIAVLPLAVRAFTGISALAIGGTALLIVVSVALDLIKKIDAQISMREY